MPRPLETAKHILVGWSLVAAGLTGCVGKPERETQRGVSTIATPAPTSNAQEQREDGKYAFNFTEAEVQVNSNTRIVKKELLEENSELKFRDEVAFPQFEGQLTPLQSKFNETVRSRARQEFDSYRQRQLKPLSKAERFPRYHEDVMEFLQVSYDVPFVTDRLVNVRFYASTYGRGAAHPVDYFFVFNYDLELGKQLVLSDLFSSQNRYLSTVSDYSRTIVTERICREGGWAGTQRFEECLKNGPLWEQGMKPVPENFKAWNLTKDGLLISFDPCQLTGCASGEFYALVPYSKLAGVIKPDSVVTALGSR